MLSSGRRYGPSGSAPISFYNGTGVSVYFLSAPALVTPTPRPGYIWVKWKYVDGAQGYKVYRKVPGGAWQGVATISKGDTLMYKDTYMLVRGQQYVYTVRAINGSNISGYLTSGITTTAQ